VKKNTMPKLKTQKFLSKRITITKKGKILKRMSGQNHFNSKEPGKITRKKRRDNELSPVFAKTVRRLVPYH